MNRSRWISSVGMLLLALAGAAVALPDKPSGFDQMKTLVGNWTGQNSKGAAVRVSYKLISGNTALMETLDGPEGEQMITIYHPDGGRLMMTHYCASGNQPRMRAAVPAASHSRQLHFHYVDATNLASPTAGHMADLVVEFQDNDHFTQHWTWQEPGKQMTEDFHFTREK